jgi:hypothetical protein
MSIATIEELFEWMEDFDNEDLLEDDRRAQLEDAVIEFNEQHNTTYKRAQSFYQYESWKREKQRPS